MVNMSSIQPTDARSSTLSGDHSTDVGESTREEEEVGRAERNDNGKIIVRSFRISDSTFRELKREASERDVSVSSIVDHLIKRHVEYDRLVSKFKMIGTSSYSLKLIADAVPEEKMKEIARNVASDPLLQEPLKIETDKVKAGKAVLDTMKLFAKYQSYDYSEVEQGSKKIIFFVHNAGRGWSVFVAHLWKAVLDNVGVNVEVSADERAAIFKFEKQQIMG